MLDLCNTGKYSAPESFLANDSFRSSFLNVDKYIAQGRGRLQESF